VYSTLQVIAFAMKEYGWSLDYTLELVKSKRPVICPNDGFMQQLHTYEGILNARLSPPSFCSANFF